MVASASWLCKSVADCIEPLRGIAADKVQARDYKPSGRYPIVDQGQAPIAGWTDNTSAVIDKPLPLIVFGDHTRAFKYVDFPFARGADGTQLLKPKVGIEPLFFFYACRAIGLEGRGYNRHFSVLKQRQISYPQGGGEQRAIGEMLRKTESARCRQDVLVEKAQALKQAAMRELFTRGLRGEAQKETEIGLVPESWATKPLHTHHSVGSGGTPSRSRPDYWLGGTIPWVKTAEVAYCVIERTEEHITPEALAESAAKVLPAGTLLMAMYGQGVTRGKVALLGIDAACNQACAAIAPKDTTVNTRFLYHFLAWRYDAIRSLAHGGQQQNLNLEIVRDLPIAFPTGTEQQHDIVAILDAIDRKIALHQRKRAVLEELFKSLLHKLMTGEIAVADLDLQSLQTHDTATADIREPA